MNIIIKLNKMSTAIFISTTFDDNGKDKGGKKKMTI